MSEYLKNVKDGNMVGLIRKDGNKCAFLNGKVWVENPALIQWFEKVRPPFEKATTAEVDKFMGKKVKEVVESVPETPKEVIE